MAEIIDSNKQTLATFYEKIASENLPKMPLFKAKLQAYMDEQKKKISFLNVPWVVRKCCDWLSTPTRLKTEGIFRVPGSHNMIQKLCDMFEQGQNPDFDKTNALVEDVSGLLKKYLRELTDLPLISDGTPADALQQSVKPTLSMEGDEQLSKVADILRQIPLSRRQLLFDLITLLTRVSVFAEINLMDPQNLATIFGGMGDIVARENVLNATERTDFTRYLIENYEALFDNLFELKAPKEDSALDNAKEAIRIYLADGTFKAMFCQGNETAKGMVQKTIAKIQTTSNIDTTNYQLWEVRDVFCRKIGDKEKILAITKAKSALVFTDKLKEVPLGTPTIPGRKAAAKSTEPDKKKQLTPHKKKEKKSSRPGIDELSPLKTRGLRSDSLGGHNPRGDKKAKPGELKKQYSEADGVKPPSPRPSSTPNSPRPSFPALSPTTSSPVADAAAAETAVESSNDSASNSATDRSVSPAPGGPSDGFVAWLFLEIPPESVRASEWDTEKNVEGVVTISPEGGVVHVVSEGLSADFEGTSIKQVEDSSRYFVFKSADKRIGVGFETREESLRFRADVLASLPQGKVEESSLKSPALVYYNGPLPSSVAIDDGFYDPGPRKEGLQYQSLEELQKKPVDLDSREVILVDVANDVRLARLIGNAHDLAQSSSSLLERVRIVAMFVSSVTGGIDSSAGFLESEPNPDTSLEALSRKNIDSLRKQGNSNVVKLGSITHGVSRHRAMLFKVICDRLEPPIPVALLRSDPVKKEGDITWNYVTAFEPLKYVYVDLTHDPGRVYHSKSEEVARLTAFLHGSPLDMNEKSSRRPSIFANEAVRNFNILERLITAPGLQNDAELKIYDSIGLSASAQVHRGTLGPFTVAVKEITNAAKLRLDRAVDLADITQQRTSIEHKNIAHCFGYEVTDKAIRVLNEYLGRKSLSSVVKERNTWQDQLPEDHVWFYIHEVAQGLAHLHSAGHIHGTLKSSNVVLDGSIEPYTTVKLTDMAIRPSNVASWHSAGHRRYFAPEVLDFLAADQPNSSGVDFKAADIWSLGLLIVELATLQKPYPGLTEDERQTAIREAKCPPLLQSSSPFAEIVQLCCQQDPTARPKAEDIIARAAAFLPKTILKPLVVVSPPGESASAAATS